MRTSEKLTWLVIVACIITILAAQLGRKSEKWIVTEDSVATYYMSGGDTVIVWKGGRK